MHPYSGSFSLGSQLQLPTAAHQHEKEEIIGGEEYRD